MDPRAVGHTLEQIASFLELKGDDDFRVRAYRHAAHVIEDYHGDLATAVRSGTIADEAGIGPGTLAVLRDLQATGRSSVLESLKREVPEGLVEMLRISGLGVAKVRRLHEELRLSTVAELEVAARDGRLAKLPRFGAKTAERILRGIAFLRRTGDFHLLHHALRQGEQLRQALRGLPGVRAAEISGSVRRRSELVRDVDLAVASDERPAELLARASTLPGVADVVGTGDAEFTLHFAGGIAAKVYVGGPADFGHLLARTTGSRAHLDQLIGVAVARGLTLSAAGLARGGVPVPCPDEATLYRALGLDWVPPELREGADEVARAAAGTLPALVERADLLGFVHCHTNYSDGANTVAEVAAACGEAGYRYVGVTDHSEASRYAGGLTEEALLRQHAEIDAHNARRGPVRVLKGIEADILEDGTLDYSPEFLDRFDFVIASVHAGFGLDEEAMTARVLRALDDPHTAILGHPTGRMLLEREPYAIDMTRVIARAAELGVAIEINADPQRLDMDWHHAAAARGAGVRVPISADAHGVSGLGNVELGLGMARKAGLTRDDVLNTRDVEGFLAHARARRR